MSPSSPPSSRAPAGVPPSGNGKYIAIVAVLVVGLGIVISLRTCNKGGDPPRPIALIDAAPTPHENPDDNVPPPPPPEEDAGQVAVAKPTNNGAGFDPCAVKTCGGAATSDLESGLQFRAKQAHRCYDQALAQDSTLQGKMGVSLRIAANGQVCKADVASNDLGSPAVAQCVVNMFRQSGHFPVPKGGCVDLVLPINFKASR